MSESGELQERSVFGVPVILTDLESKKIGRALKDLWKLTYGAGYESLEADLKRAGRLFDPLLRGFTLRDRLAEIPVTPKSLVRDIGVYGAPLTTDVGEHRLVVGIEGRLIGELLLSQPAEDGLVVISARSVAAYEHRALEAYRAWAHGRLAQVVALRAGEGEEVMQGVAVGLVLALLVNRVETDDRAIFRLDHTSVEGEEVNWAIHAGAEQFAAVVTSGRNSRSQGEQRLKGGYALSEARRRLAHRLADVVDKATSQKRVYIPKKYREEVLDFLARDLSRRPKLTSSLLGEAFDRLVEAFRQAAGQLARRSMVFERSADTADLKNELLIAFVREKRRVE